MSMSTERLNRLRGRPIHAVDGEIGGVADFYFDDDEWTVRYLVVDTGRWLPRRQVLLPVSALLRDADLTSSIPTRLTREQITRSPDIDTRQPVFRRMELHALRYYGYPMYWGGSALWGPAPTPWFGARIPPAGVVSASDEEIRAAEADARATHLRSCREVTGYHIRATDGELGHIDDFVIDADTWAIRHLLIDTSNWIGGRAVLIEPRWVTQVSWDDRILSIAVAREAILPRLEDSVGDERTPTR
jgi:sporulation protein YlmC with PRC-barrel domain